ncbi:DUF1214 domain-containing protein [Bradyrhizobium algeriense]|uniref:DUF1214 domain-containing protein n=1 Tax=Bradyrhizobium algeriense TaxID=634784 RepID=UPI001FCECFCE|nr:DUF1214 domain-containing protein [Bradyrhizobium algeriense]
MGEKPGQSGAAFFDLYTTRAKKAAANIPCEGNVQCQDGSLTLYAGAKSPGVDRESNWLPASGQFSLHIRAYWAGSPSSTVSGDRLRRHQCALRSSPCPTPHTTEPPRRLSFPLVKQNDTV